MRVRVANRIREFSVFNVRISYPTANFAFELAQTSVIKIPNTKFPYTQKTKERKQIKIDEVTVKSVQK